MENKKRKSVYDPKAIKKYRSNLSPEKKAEQSRRNVFYNVRSFIRDEKYTLEEFDEIKRLIESKMKCELYS